MAGNENEWYRRQEQSGIGMVYADPPGVYYAVNDSIHLDARGSLRKYYMSNGADGGEIQIGFDGICMNPTYNPDGYKLSAPDLIEKQDCARHIYNNLMLNPETLGTNTSISSPKDNSKSNKNEDVFYTYDFINEIKNYPERFSPNALMRPLYQEVILPNVAYVGGQAELAYWFQLKGLFDFKKIPFPILCLRNSSYIAKNIFIVFTTIT